MRIFPPFGAEEEFLLVETRTGEPAPRNTAVAGS
jgi:glutamate---cysteine ligase / carboxylate-amine ligase